MGRPDKVRELSKAYDKWLATMADPITGGVAMFDEVDEGTAIFKCTNDRSTGGGAAFLTYEGLPSDHYLKLVGEAGKLLRDELPDSRTDNQR